MHKSESWDSDLRTLLLRCPSLLHPLSLRFSLLTTQGPCSLAASVSPEAWAPPVLATRQRHGPPLQLPCVCLAKLSFLVSSEVCFLHIQEARCAGILPSPVLSKQQRSRCWGLSSSLSRSPSLLAFPIRGVILSARHAKVRENCFSLSLGLCPYNSILFSLLTAFPPGSEGETSLWCENSSPPWAGAQGRPQPALNAGPPRSPCPADLQMSRCPRSSPAERFPTLTLTTRAPSTPVISQLRSHCSASLYFCSLWCPRLTRPSCVLRCLEPAQEASRILVQGPCLPTSGLPRSHSCRLPALDLHVLVGGSHVWFVP